MDVYWYRDWAIQMAEKGLFNCYEHISDLDYPPGYIFPLFIMGKLCLLHTVYNSVELSLLVMKFLPIVFDIFTAALFYVIVRKKSESLAFFAAAFWAFNPVAIFNSSCWGQTDGIFVFLLVLCFYLFEEQRPLAAVVVFAISGVTKYQTLLFAPLVILELFSNYNIRKAVQSLLAGISVGIIAFLPYLRDSGLYLPLRLYTGGFGQYDMATLNAFNLYGLLGLNWVKDSSPMPGIKFISIYQLSMLVMILALAVLVFLYFKSNNKYKIWLLSPLFFQIIFMFTSRMHERYQIIVVPLLLIAYTRIPDIKILLSHIALTLMSFLNHVIFLTHFNAGSAKNNSLYNLTMQILSAVNIVIFIAVACLLVYHLLRPRLKDQISPQPA